MLGSPSLLIYDVVCIYRCYIRILLCFPSYLRYCTYFDLSRSLFRPLLPRIFLSLSECVEPWLTRREQLLRHWLVEARLQVQNWLRVFSVPFSLGRTHVLLHACMCVSRSKAWECILWYATALCSNIENERTFEGETREIVIVISYGIHFV
jgi:hypothetical protein